MRYLIFLLLLAAACASPYTSADRTAIASVMSAQEKAWDSADIEGFMDGYWDEVCFLGKTGQNCGRDSVTARYKRSYPDAAAMGNLTFGTIEVLPAGEDHAWCTGTWRLERTADTLNGRFSLLWQRRGAEWRILRDHSD